MSSQNLEDLWQATANPSSPDLEELWSLTDPSTKEEGPTRSSQRALKNATAGMAGRVVDVGVGLPVILGQLVGRVPGALGQVVGDFETRVSQLPQLDEQTRQEHATRGAEWSQMGKGMNEEVGNLTRNLTSLGGLSPKTETPFFSGLGLTNQLVETALPQTAPQNKQEVANDAFWQIMMGSPPSVKGLIGTTSAAAGGYEAIKEDDPRYALAGIAAPYLADKAIKGVANVATSVSPTGKAMALGYRPELFADDVGQSVVQNVKGEKQALGITKNAIDQRIGTTPGELASQYEARLMNELGINNLDKGTLSKFRQSVAQMKALSGGSLTPEDFVNLKEQYRNAANSSNTAAQVTIKGLPGKGRGLQGVIREGQMNQANAAGEAVNLAKFNKEYDAITKFEKDFIGNAGPETSKVYKGLYGSFKSDPDYYAQEVSKLAPPVQQELNSMHMKSMGMGEKGIWDYKKWADEVIALNPKSRMILAGNDAARAEKLLNTAIRAKEAWGLLNLAAGGLRLAAYGSAGLPGLLAARTLANPKGLSAISGALRIKEKNFPIAKERLMNTLTTVMQEEGAKYGIPMDGPTNPQPSEPVAPPVAPERDVPDLPLYNKKQEAEFPVKGAIHSESGGDVNADNPVSTASGALQYTDGTWRDVIDKYPEMGYTMADKNNLDAQVHASEILTKEEYVPALNKAKIPVTDAAIYALHHFGQGNGIKLLQKRESNLVAKSIMPAKVVRDNPKVFFDENKRPRTVKQVYAWLDKRLKEGGEL